MLRLMSRPLRIEFEGAWYHVMNRGRARQDVFADDTDHETFLETVGEAVERFGAEIHAYCLMPNHYHLLVRTPRGNLGRVMRHIDGLYTQRYNRRHGVDGPLFRGRYRAILVEADAYLLSVSRYIHRNPTDGVQPLVDEPDAWPWSSFPAFVGQIAPPVWLSTGPTLEMLGTQNRSAAYRRFVQTPPEEELMAFYANQRATPILGDESFRERMLGRVPPTADVTRPPEHPLRTPEAVVATVAGVFGVESDQLLARGTGRSGAAAVARQMAMLLCRDRAGLTLREVGQRFGDIHYSAVHQNICRLKERLGKNADLSDAYKAVLSRLDP